MKMNKKPKNLKLEKGFSLPEVLVSISIIIVVIVSSINLLTASIRANSNNVNRIVAYNLAQEALEGVRNIRDTYWLHGQSWLGQDSEISIGNNIGDNFGNSFTIERVSNPFRSNTCDSDTYNNVQFVNGVFPWKVDLIQQAEPENSDRTRLYLIEDTGLSGNQMGFNYSHSGDEEQLTNFRRYITITSTEEDYNEPGSIKKVEVEATVTWLEGSKKKDLTLSTILTDWKDGPL